MLKMAVLAPMPSASTTITAAANPGAFSSVRIACVTSCTIPTRGRRVPQRTHHASSNSEFRILISEFVLFRDGHFHPLLDHAAVEQMDATLGVTRVSRIVRHHADRRARAVQLAEQIHHG